MYNGTEWISLSVTTTNKQINSSCSCWRLLAPGVGTVVAVRIGGVAVAVAVAVAGVTVVGDGVALGHGVKALGDGVQTGGGAEGNGGGIGVGAVGSCVGVAEVLGLGTSHQTGLKIQNR